MDAQRGVLRLEQFIGGFRFPALLLALLAGWSAWLTLALLLPPPPGALGAMAAEFKVWCFGFDPATGEVQWGRTAVMFSEPLLLGGILVGVWWKPIADAVRRDRAAFTRWSAAGFALSAMLAASLGMATTGVGSAVGGPLPFPATALRLHHAPPSIDLVDQEGLPARLHELKGRVVVLTGVYAHCAAMCPRILTALKSAWDGVDSNLRRDLTVLAITLDPDKDSPATLAELAKAYGVSAPAWRLLTGPPATVNHVLDTMEIARKRDPATGEISHPGVYLLVGRDGTLAYRLALSETQKHWLGEAMDTLLREPAPQASLPAPPGLATRWEPGAGSAAPAD